MRIIVCIKQVPDPESSQDCFEIDEASNMVIPRGIPPMLSLYDENALEAALQIKEEREGLTEIIALSLGKKISKAVMMRALAAGADSVVKIEDDVFESGVLDVFDTAKALAAAIDKIGGVDLVLTGRQAADWNSGQVGIALAELLYAPCITLARKIEIKAGKVRVKRLIQNGYEIVESDLPTVVVVSSEVGELRYPAMKARRKAKNKPIESLELKDMDFTAEKKSTVFLNRLEMAEIPLRKCEFIVAETFEKAGRKLAEKLNNANLLRR